MIEFDQENAMWEKEILGECTPDQLRRTVLFLIGLNVGLRAGDEQYALRRDSPDMPPQLSFKRNSNGERCLVYTEDTVTKTNDGGQSHMNKERKVVWVYPSEKSCAMPCTFGG